MDKKGELFCNACLLKIEHYEVRVSTGEKHYHFRHYKPEPGVDCPAPEPVAWKEEVNHA